MATFEGNDVTISTERGKDVSRLSNRQYVQLGRAISSPDMESIAIGYLNFDEETIKSLRYESSGNFEAFNRDILKRWANRNAGPDQVKNLAQLLFAAGRECSYVDPQKIAQILGVGAPLPPVTGFAHCNIMDTNFGNTIGLSKNSTGSQATKISWQEVLDIADNLRPYTSQAMKMEVAPWIRDYVVDLEELYTQLTLEKINNKIAGECTKTLKDYREVFDEILMTYKDTAEQKNDSVPDDFGRLYDVVVESVNEGMVDESDDFAPDDFVIDDTEKSVEPQKGKKVLMKGDLDDFTPDDFVIDDTEKV